MTCRTNRKWIDENEKNETLQWNKWWVRENDEKPETRMPRISIKLINQGREEWGSGWLKGMREKERSNVHASRNGKRVLCVVVSEFWFVRSEPKNPFHSNTHFLLSLSLLLSSRCWFQAAGEQRTKLTPLSTYRRS